MIRSTGFLDDPEGHVYTSARRLIGSAQPAAAASVDEYAPPILDQGGKEECVGQGIGGAVDTSYEAAAAAARRMGVPMPTRPYRRTSPSWIHKLARAVDREDPSVPLENWGCNPNQAARAIAEFGLVGFGDVSELEQDVNEEPTVLAFEIASRVHAVDLRRIYATDRELVVDIMRTIDTGRMGVPFACDVDRPFFDWRGGRVMGPELGESKGGHMMFFSAYRTTSSGAIVFKIRNSYGVFWGDAGCAEVSDEFVMRRVRAVFAAGYHFRGAA